MAALGYAVALLFPILGLAIGWFLRGRRDERFHGPAIMAVAGFAIVACVLRHVVGSA
jgi:hypothetical protein